MKLSEYNFPVAENIQRIINEKGLKQVYVAEKAGYTAHMLSDMLAGRKIIKACDVHKICEVLGVDANSLFDKENYNREPQQVQTVSHNL